MISSKVGGFSRSVVGVVLLPLHFSKGGFNLLKGVEKLCDVDGRFEFDSLPGGDYYVIASVFGVILFRVAPIL